MAATSTWSTEVLGAVRNLERCAPHYLSTGQRFAVWTPSKCAFPVTSELQLAGRVDHSPNGQRGWRLLTPLLLGLYRQRQSVSVAVHMGISAEALAELLAGSFPAGLSCKPHLHRQPRGQLHPVAITWTGWLRNSSALQ
ncbi:hypothetical protein HPB52_009828 [Rhipicephalus sanguineus]|uniref:Uncharacterized protein n=1 Tax=Rhipicephalus sanguineus TaxID=34632 RepID=A0A9D4SP11_RHISA|nr:hypothetical protein HPB52_009828 [Rhipicephalus sanguineus]